MWTKCLAIMFFCGALLPAQSVGLGLKLGVPLESHDNHGIKIDGGRGVIGPSAELRLPLGLSVEGCALYSNFNTKSLAITGNVTDATRWEFPVVGKLRFGAGPLRPFAAAGPVFGWVKNSTGSVSKSGFTDTGFTVGAGLEAKIPFVRLVPEFRYIHNRPGYFGDHSAMLLLGVTF